MGFRVALDADVLVPIPLCDTLLRFAEVELFDPVWSERILAEVERALVDNIGASPDKARLRIEQMRLAFPDASVDEAAIAKLEPAMTNNSKDKHVLAAAIAGSSQILATSNVRDFPEEVCAPFGIEVLPPDDFLLRQLGLSDVAVLASLNRQASDLRAPSATLGNVLATLRQWAPRFVAEVTVLL